MFLIHMNKEHKTISTEALAVITGFYVMAITLEFEYLISKKQILTSTTLHNVRSIFSKHRHARKSQ